LLVTVVLVSGWLRDRASRAYFIEDQRRVLSHRAELIRVRVQSAIDGVRKDVLYLSHAPAFARLAAARTAAEREAARREAAFHFAAGLQVRPAYFQARLVGAADGGRELLRFDQSGGDIHETPEADLQRGVEADCVREAGKLRAGQFYLSDLALNRESGRLTEPHIPTLRAATPLFDEAGGLFGVVIVKVDVAPLFDELCALAGPGLAVTLSNEQGDYLLHPDRAKCFGFDLGRRFLLWHDAPQLQQDDRHGRFEAGEEELSLTDEFPFTSGADRSVILRLAALKAPLLAPLRARRAQNFAVTLALAVLAGSVVFIVTNLFARGLRRVADAVERYEPGKPLPDLPPDSPDEVGLLTRKFRDMAAKISEQMQSLHEARQRAEAGVRAREEFLATVSHEIRTPMNAVLGMAHLLESEGTGGRQAERLRALKFAGRHLMALLNNLLDRERIESGEIVFDRLDFDLAELLENLHHSLEPLAGRKGLEFALDTRPGLPRRVHGDPVRLYQVLNNLAHNAIKFTEHGRVAVEAQAGAGDEITFRVSDSGPGLPAPVLAALTGAAAWSASAGLGLRISQRLIQLLGGPLQAQSGPGGTTLAFSLRLPAAAAPSAGRGPEEPPDLAGYSALIIEDLPSNQLVLAALLEKTGMSAESATTGAQARDRVRAVTYDFAFLDLQLPDADGADLARALIALQPELRVVAVTAQVSAATRAACESAGVRAFVPKPIAPAELYDKLRRLTAPRLEAVERMFDGDAAKVAAYLAQLDRECEAWDTELSALGEQPDAERLRRLHHRMKNALGQLDLWKLDRALDALREAVERGQAEQVHARSANARRWLSAARQLTGAKRFSTSSR